MCFASVPQGSVPGQGQTFISCFLCSVHNKFSWKDFEFLNLLRQIFILAKEYVVFIHHVYLLKVKVIASYSFKALFCNERRTNIFPAQRSFTLRKRITLFSVKVTVGRFLWLTNTHPSPLICYTCNWGNFFKVKVTTWSLYYSCYGHYYFTSCFL